MKRDHGRQAAFQGTASIDYRRLSGGRAYSISVASGKGGVGKTVTSIHLAAGLSRMGRKVLLLDGDLGLANVDIVLGVRPRYNISDVIFKGVGLNDVLIEGPGGFMLAPASSGLSSMHSLSDAERDALTASLKETMEGFDFVLIDNGAGITDSVQHFCGICDHQMVVTTPEPHAMADAYALMKVLWETKGLSRFLVVVNMVMSEAEGRHAFERLRKVAKSFLGAEAEYLGSVPADQKVQDAVVARSVGSRNASYTIAGQSYHALCSRISDLARAARDTGKPLLWQSMLSLEA